MYSILLAIEFCYFLYLISWEKVFYEYKFGHLIVFFCVLTGSCRNLVASGKQKKPDTVTLQVTFKCFLSEHPGCRSVAGLLHMKRMWWTVESLYTFF